VTATGPPLPFSPAAIAHDKWLSRFRTILVGILGCAVAGIGSLAFYTSFEAIKAYAQRSGGIAPQHAWAVPLLVDSFIVVATGADLWFTTTKQTRRVWEIWWPKALLAGAAGVSFILNVAHAQSGNWAARGVAAIPPAALILGVELLMMVLRRATTIRAARLQAELDKQQLELAALASPAPVRGEITRKQRRPRREMPVPSAEQASDEDERQPEGERQPAGERGPESERQPAAGERQPAAGERQPAGGERQPATGERDPSVPIFTPATPARGENGRLAAAARSAAAAVRNVTASPKPSAARAAEAPKREAMPAPAEPARPAAVGAAAVFASARPLRTDKRPGALDKNGKPMTPYVVAARILDERDVKGSLTPEALVQALSEEGLNVSVTVAQELLRELRPPLASRMSAQQRAAATGRRGGDGRAVAAGLAAKAKDRAG
jgi:hypothetical protein